MLPGIRRPCLIASAASALLITGAAPTLGQLSFEAGPEAPNGRSYPLVPNNPLGLAQQLAQVESALGANNPEQLGTLAHRQQVLFRHWARQLDWDRAVLALLPKELRARARLQVQARREFLAMHRGQRPRRNYPLGGSGLLPQPKNYWPYINRPSKPRALTGPPWPPSTWWKPAWVGCKGSRWWGPGDRCNFYPAPGRNQALARAPSIIPAMQSLPPPATWCTGGRTNLARAIWGYNNSWHYVRAVQAYANLMRTNPSQFQAFHSWQIHFASPVGDLWLPEGYERHQPVPVGQHLREAPWSAPPAR